MRVISGKARGTKLDSIEKLSTRPTLDRVKEALFSSLQPYIDENTKILDLFAGSGALGIEALSRGAKYSVFCDKSYESIKMLKQNIERTYFTEQARIINKDYKKCLKELEGQTFDIIFIDPPYHLNIAVDACEIIEQQGLLAKEGIIILETDDEQRENQKLENSKLEVYNVRKYGRVKLMFLHERG